MNRQLLVDKIHCIYNKVINQKSGEWNLNINLWSWACGVGVFGLVKAYEATGNPKYKEFLEKWFVENENKRLFGSVNNVAPLPAVLFLAEVNGDSECLKICEEYADWCMNKSLRTCNDGFAHVWAGGDDDYKNQLWIDTIFMAGIFMLKYGMFAKNEQIIREALKQIDLHIDCLIDPENDLFYHAYHCINKEHLGQHWGRGNGWMVASLVELIDILKNSNFEISKYVEILRKVMNKAFSLKTPDGMLRTLLLVEESYTETTATSLFGYAALKGFQLDVLDERFNEWGRQVIDTISEYIDEDGIIAHCSYGTNPETKEVYMTRPCDQSLYADGIVIMLLSQGMKQYS